MALTKITPQMFDTSAAGHDFNIDNGTFVVDASVNRVGIGTASPSTLLHVNGTATATTFVGALTGNVTGTILTAAQTNITSLGTLTALTVDNIGINGDTITLTGSSATGFIQTSANTVQMGSSTSDQLILYTDNTAAITIDTSQNATFAGTIATGGITINGAGSTISDSSDLGIVSGGDLTIDVTGDIVFDADGGDFNFKDGGTTLLSLSNAGSNNVQISTSISDGDLLFKGVDGGSIITALTLDMSEGGKATFANDIAVADNRGLRLGSDNDSVIYNDGSNLYIKNNTSNQDIIFQGNDDGSAGLQMLKLDASDAGNATFSGDITGTGDTKYLATGDIGIGPRQGSATNGAVYIGGNTDNPFVSPVAIFSGDGKVGISTSSPKTFLHVSGLTSDDDPSLGASTAPFFVTNTADNYGLNIGVNNAGASWLQSQSNLSATAYDLLLNPLGGKVGIGTTNPVAQFAVGGAGRRIEIQGGDGVIRGFDRTASWAQIDFEAASYVFDISGSEAMRIDSSGNTHFGKSAFSVSTDGATITGNGAGTFTSTQSSANQESVLFLNRKSTDGDIIKLYKDSSVVGAIMTNAGALVLKGASSSAPVQLQTHDGNEDIEVDPDGFIKFETAGSERMRIDSNGNLLVNSATSNAKLSVKGAASLRAQNVQVAVDGHTAIGFFNASGTDVGGIAISSSGASINLGGNAAANTLDDYEEGTWTPTLIAGTTNPTGGGALAPSGTYTKIGNRVWVTFYVGRSWTNSPSGQVYLGSLPFTVHSTSPNAYFATVTTYKVDFGTANIPFLIPSGGANSAALYTAANGGTWSSLTWQTHMTSSGGSYITGTFHYVVA